MTAAHYKGGHHPGNDLGLHYTALPPIVASCPYSDQLLVTRKFWSPAANRPSQVSGAGLSNSVAGIKVTLIGCGGSMPGSISRPRSRHQLFRLIRPHNPFGDATP